MCSSFQVEERVDPARIVSGRNERFGGLIARSKTRRLGGEGRGNEGKLVPRWLAHRLNVVGNNVVRTRRLSLY